ncbi:retropepsin-like aspartic protease family protein [Nereida ignava]|jgi:aspartyl protease family protein|uniref:retropepsin-like aspartic protease family protein n=1 Tax=Nereida ignava TaxID=282199 RepID=UPI0030F5BA22
MDGGDTAQLLYMGLLIVAIGGSYLVSQRRNLGKTLQQAAIWVLIILGAIAGVGLWEDISGTVTQAQNTNAAGQIEVPRRADGHFHLTLQVNGVGVPFLVDTGASEIVLTQDDARRVGFDTATLDYFGRANTANGTVSIAFVRLETVQLGEIMDTGVRATVNSAPMEGSLLGMSYLQRFAEVSIRGNTLILTR